MNLSMKFIGLLLIIVAVVLCWLVVCCPCLQSVDSRGVKTSGVFGWLILVLLIIGFGIIFSKGKL